MKSWETKEGKIFCPVNGWDCPYFKKNGECSLDNVDKECDDFYFFWGNEIDGCE